MSTIEDRAGAVRELLGRRAIEAGLVAPGATQDLVDAAIESLLDREVKAPEPTEAECRRWYDAHPRASVADGLVYARHILFGVTPGVPVDRLRRKAEETLAELRADASRFEALARELSNCPSGAHGGALGQLARQDAVPEFADALFDSEDTGVLPRLVNTRFGFHIVAIDRRVAGRRVPFEAVRERIASQLTERVWERALTQYVQVLAGRAGVDDPGLSPASSPLVQ